MNGSVSDRGAARVVLFELSSFERAMIHSLYFILTKCFSMNSMSSMNLYTPSAARPDGAHLPIPLHVV